MFCTCVSYGEQGGRFCLAGLCPGFGVLMLMRENIQLKTRDTTVTHQDEQNELLTALLHPFLNGMEKNGYVIAQSIICGSTNT